MSGNTEDRAGRSGGLLPIIDAGRILGRSPWTLKRLYKGGHLPVVISGRQWLIPESFVAMVLSSPRPGQAGVLEDIAKRWFAMHSEPEVATA